VALLFLAVPSFPSVQGSAPNGPLVAPHAALAGYSSPGASLSSELRSSGSGPNTPSGGGWPGALPAHPEASSGLACSIPRSGSETACAPRSVPPFPPYPASSSASEIGGVVGKVFLGVNPTAATYDPLNGNVYVADEGTNLLAGSMSEVNGTTVVSTFDGGSNPTGVVFDAYSGEIYVADFTGNDVSVVSGHTVVATVGVGTGPYALDADSQNGLVYVANYVSTEVSVIRGTTVTASPVVGSEPDGVAYDSSNGYVYVAVSGTNSVAVINGVTVIAQIPVGSEPAFLGYDPKSNLVYCPNYGSENVSIINGTRVVATINTSKDSYAAMYDAGNGFEYVDNWVAWNDSIVDVFNGTSMIANTTVLANLQRGAYCPDHGLLYIPDYLIYSGRVVVMATELGISPLGDTTAGNSTTTTDAGDPVNLNTTLWAVGSAPDVARVATEPAVGFGCLAASVLSFTPIGAIVHGACVPTTPGNYTVWMNVTDQNGTTVQSTLLFIGVGPALVVPAPIASSGDLAALTSADVAEVVQFSERPSGGTGSFYGYSWYGLPIGTCTGTNTAQVQCTITESGSSLVTVTVSDSNGPVTSSGLRLPVFARPAPKAPTTSLPAADAGQSVTFNVVTFDGSGNFTGFLWSGLASDQCADLSTASPVCLFTSESTIVAYVVVSDANGGQSAPSPTVTLVVSQALSISGLTFSPRSATVGQGETFSVTASGGAGDYRFNWSNLPPGCSGSSATISCTPSNAGFYNVSVSVTDANDFTAHSTAAILTVAPSSGASTILGLSAPVWLGVVVVIVVVAVALFLFLRPKKPAPEASEGTDEEAAPPTEDDEPPAS